MWVTKPTSWLGTSGQRAQKLGFVALLSFTVVFGLISLMIFVNGSHIHASEAVDFTQ